MMGMGRNRKPVGKTRGKYEAGALKITCYAATSAQIEADLAAAAGSSSYGDLEFSCTLQLIEPGATLPIIYQFDECTDDSDTLGGAGADNADAAKVEITFSPNSITKNGLSLYAAS